MRILQRFTRPAVAFAHDTAVAALSFLISLYLRTGGDFFNYPTDFLAGATILFTAIAGVVFWWFDVHRGIWRYASLNDLIGIARAATLVILLFLASMFVVTRLEDLPRSLVFINWFVLMILLGGPRVLYRRLKDGRISFMLNPRADKRVPILLVGAGDGADMFIQATERGAAGGAEYRVVGIIDDNPMRVGRLIRGVEVLGSLDNLAAVTGQLDSIGKRPQRIIVTKSDIAGASLRQIVDVADQLGLNVARLPRLTEFRTADAERIEVRPIAIEDLLGRPQAVLDRAAMKALVADKKVLLTGAGGTIGSELARQIADLGPARLTLVDNSEFNLYSIDLELGERCPAVPRSAVLADVRDGARLEALLAADRPELVFHAAALKHVPMVEAYPCEGVLTNVIATRRLAEACRNIGVGAMVLISTDKAVNPSSVMGASKRLAESWCQALDIDERAHGGRTRFITVRFGNVLGSTGSVVPLFQRQLAAGGPLTVTHPEITRYFMTVREAVELVLEASALGAVFGGGGADGGRIYVLDMGEPVKIVDLARQMIRLAGFRPDVDIRVAFTGLRPGEKLYEELFHEAEPLQPTSMNGILLASPRVTDRAFLARALDDLAAAAFAGNNDATLSLLQRLVPEYQTAGSITNTGRVGSGT